MRWDLAARLVEDPEVAGAAIDALVAELRVRCPGAVGDLIEELRGPGQSKAADLIEDRDSYFRTKAMAASGWGSTRDGT